MDDNTQFEIFLTAAPGLEKALLQEARDLDFSGLKSVPGGVTCQGSWPEVWRANLCLRGAARVLARIGEFRAFHLAQLDKRARKFPWGDVLRSDIPVRVEVVTNKKSKIYHAGAACQRIERALAESFGVPVVKGADTPDAITLKLRIDDNNCLFSVDTSGEGLHKRGHKVAIGKAPMRETLAALFLRECGYDGTQTIVDPMCGSGTFVLEAAEIALGLLPGRTRSFAFENLATFDAEKWDALKAKAGLSGNEVQPRFFGSDRNAGVVEMAAANADRAGVSELVSFKQAAVSDLQPPPGDPGLVIVNPPYGARIGNKKLLYALYVSLGQTLQERFKGWRVGIVTSETGLAKATELPFLPYGPPVAHGGLKIRLFQTGPL
ncbi:THUMP domain-containing class I SAM-dependent RNA methyltransferase [Epibacterium ulvae]|uniref:THUMP domain-containing class I SAM-dependent RNA methyltransferase n=1 Tax=Epibacterium ulvae TaxID=1156985 RepID=UPI002492C385|nr:class I SAM-dependent RNA methyltransferase [Epibacterium ulvae]